MDKIVIIGSPGAGKSTFAQQLGQALKIEVFHLDRYFWQDDWKEYPREDRVKIQQKLVRGKQRWIMEGSYISSANSRLGAADTIIFLDTPFLLCLWRVIKRHTTTPRQGGRPDIPEGCTDRLRLIYILKVLVFPCKGRILLLHKILQQTRSDIPEGRIDWLCLLYLLMMLILPYRWRSLLLKKICAQGQDRMQQKDIRVLRSNRHIQAFLREQATEHFQEDISAECEVESTRSSANSCSKLAPAYIPLACFSMVWVSLRHFFFSEQPLSDDAPTVPTIPLTPLTP